MIRNIFPCLIVLVTFIACNHPTSSTTETKLDPTTQIARAHGFENWKNVTEIRFTFNVDRDTSHFERSWIWNVKEQKVTRITPQDTLSYFRNQVSDSLKPVDSGFINDKFWLLFPYQLLWDTHAQIEVQDSVTAPISGKILKKLTVIYPQHGGYTPGDAYDAYFGDDYMLQEWVYRKANQAEASLATTWESYSDYSGLKLATTHRRGDGNFTLYFTGIEVKTNLSQ